MTNASWRETKNFTDRIQGWLSDVENRSLFEAAKRVGGTGVIVEIGSWKGRSTVCLALGSRAGAGAPVYAIDPHTGSPDLLREGETVWSYDEFMRNMREAHVEHIVRPMLTTGEEAAKDWAIPVSLLFIDANYHSYPLTLELLRVWIPHMRDGGIVALNNVTPSFSAIFKNHPLHGLPGPRKVACEELLRSHRYRKFKRAGCILYAESCAQNTWSDRLKGRIVEAEVRMLVLLHKIYLRLTRLPQPVKNTLKRLAGLGRKVR